MFVFFADHNGAEEGERALELFELIAGHGVIGEVGVAVGHGEGSVAYSLFIRHKVVGKGATERMLRSDIEA